MAKHVDAQFDLTALAAAIQRLLNRTGTEDRPSRGMYRGHGTGLFYGRPGSFQGKIATLFAALCDTDDAWFYISARPHDKSALRRFLKANAGELHEHWGLVITLDKQQICIDRVEANVK